MARSTQLPEPPETTNGGTDDSLFSPGFKSVVAMAGWDEEAILIASLVVDDTPERELKQKKRHPDLRPKTPPSNSRRKRRVPQRSPIPATVLNLDDICSVPEKPPSVEVKIKSRTGKNDDKKRLETSVTKCEASSSGAVIPFMDKLRDELSCAICLEICYEPSTTPCGHSFCKKCLRSSAEKCGKKCPKCRQLIGNGRSCTVNTVLWNSIQLLFPQEIEPRKKVAEGSKKSPDSAKRHTAVRVREQHMQSPTFRAVRVSSSSRSPTFHPIRVSNRNREGTRTRTVTVNEVDEVSILNEAPRVSEGFRYVRTNRDEGARRRREAPRQAEGAWRRSEAPVPSQAEDAALALRLQREEFMEAFRGEENESLSVATARANLRAMASRAMSLRVSRGGRP